jgi:hypothetical protein
VRLRRYAITPTGGQPVIVSRFFVGSKAAFLIAIGVTTTRPAAPFGKTESLVV